MVRRFKVELTQADPSSLTQRSTLVALLVAGAFFMENLDGTVIATALPQMAHTFGASPVDLNVGMTAYMLTLAVFIPVGVSTKKSIRTTSRRVGMRVVNSRSADRSTVTSSGTRRPVSAA